ncbi:MAG: SUMF1/EgtB/PvdO family nonheme iron enzyme, partial [Anaerolineae bacterium]
MKRVRRWLAALLETPDVLAPRERAEAGDVLARLGDPRPGAGRGILWVEVPAGRFRMGSPEGDDMAWDDEHPQHTLDLPGFFISRYPVTNAQYRPFVEDGGYEEPRYWTLGGWAWRTGQREPDLSVIDDKDIRTSWAQWLAGRPATRRDRPFWWDQSPWNLDSRPVVGVSWYEAVAFCAWLAEQFEARNWVLDLWPSGSSSAIRASSHVTLRVGLPSEAEWEKAARSEFPPAVEGDPGRARRWPWGDEWIEGRANTEEAGLGETSAVGIFPAGASPCGALDMAGNVWEWTRSRWGRTSIRRPDYGYPYEPDDGREEPDGPDLRVVRGGSWSNDQGDARCAFRGGYIPDVYDGDLGFRVVVSL